MIRIKIALVEPNDAYRTRLAGALEASYQDRVEVVSFSSLEKADVTYRSVLETSTGKSSNATVTKCERRMVPMVLRRAMCKA